MRDFDEFFGCSRNSDTVISARGVPVHVRNVVRPRYLSRIRPFVGNGNAKVITGIRRSGKSTILKLLAAEMPDANLIYIDMDYRPNSGLRDPDALYDHVQRSLEPGRANVLMIDEVQDVPGWEEVVRSLITEECCDIYLSGSNAHLLSGEFATLLTGRVNIVDVRTLTLSECVLFQEEFSGPAAPEAALERLVRTGGFPKVWRTGEDEDSALNEIHDIVHMAIQVDISNRYKVSRPEVLLRILDYICDNIGNLVSVNNIYGALRSADRSIGKDSVYAYVRYLEEACLIEKASAVDLKGKRILTTGYKYYLSDVGIKNALLGFRQTDLSGYMENLIYLELSSRGYRAFIGNNDGAEIDLVGVRQGRRVYVQATEEITSSEVARREFGNFRGIADNFPRFVVVWRRSALSTDMDGIRCMTLAEFLLSDDY